jgi:AcrR family transcriptional regulator
MATSDTTNCGLSDSTLQDVGLPETPRGMTISELSTLSTLPLSTIKFYIREGLIPRPRKARGTKAYYDSRHLQRLRLIKKIQGEGEVRLAKIKEIVRLLDEGERAEGRHNGSGAEGLKSEIVTSAIGVFREKGYEEATIGDLVAAARVGRSTFYKHFNNKRELFVECIKHIIFSEAAERRPDLTDELKDEKDIIAAFERHAKAYFNAYPAWVDMLKQLRAAAINHPDEFADSLDEVVHLKIDLLSRSIEKGIQRGLFRKINATLMTVMLLGLQDYHGYLEKALNEKTLEELYDDVKDIILHGILRR